MARCWSALLVVQASLAVGMTVPRQPSRAQPPALSHLTRGTPVPFSRRALVTAGSMLLVPGCAHALFESAAQSSLSSLANVQPKIQGIIKEVAEIDRRRAKMTLDPEDDAYVLRFSRTALSPLSEAMAVAAPELKDERASALATELQASVASLDLACRKKSSSEQLSELKNIDGAITEFLALAKGKKFDTTAREDINTYSGATGVLYNKFLFRAG